MEARIEHAWATATVRIWLYERRPTGGIGVLRLGGDESYSFEEVERGATLPTPTLELQPQWLEALLRKASNVLPPSDATTEHLEDARATRDRILALLEHRLGKT